MTIGRYGQLDKSQDARLLRRWYNPFPVKWYQKRIDRLFIEVKEILGSEGDNELSEQVDRYYMINKMLQLSILYNALYSGMILKAGVDIALLLMNKDPKEAKNLDYFREQVKELTGIEVKEIADIIKLRDEMTRMADKFQERFRKEEPETDEKPSFYRGVMAVFSLMEMSYNDRMTLAEFAELKTLADDRRKQLEKQLEKYGTTG
jgi:hypothetical protein